MCIYNLLYILDYYKFWLRLIDSFSDINILVIVVGIYVEKKLEEVRFIMKIFICFLKLFVVKLYLEWVMYVI